MEGRLASSKAELVISTLWVANKIKHDSDDISKAENEMIVIHNTKYLSMRS